MTSTLIDCRERFFELNLKMEMIAFEWNYFERKLEKLEEELEEVADRDVKRVEEVQDEIAMVYKNFEDLDEAYSETKPKIDEAYKQFLILAENTRRVNAVNAH